MAEPAAALHAVFGADISPFTKKLDEATKIAAAKSSAMQREFERSSGSAAAFGDRAAKSIGSVAPAVEGLGHKMRGAEKSVAAMSGALDAMGARGSPAVKSIGTAVSGLISGGFTPLGIAIGAGTALLSAWAVSSVEAGRRAEELATKLSKTRTEFGALLDEVYNEGGPAVGGGASDRLRARLTQMRDIVSMADSYSRANPRQDPVQALNLTTDLAAFGATSIEDLKGKIAAAAAYLERADRESYERMLRARLPLDLEYERRRNEEVRSVLDAARVDSPEGRAAAGMSEAVDEARKRSEEMKRELISDQWAAYFEGLAQKERDEREFIADQARAAAEAQMEWSIQQDEAVVKAWAEALRGEDPSGSGMADDPRIRRIWADMKPREIGGPGMPPVTDGELRSEAIKNGSFGDGFNARMDQIRDDLYTIGEVGAEVGSSLSDSFADAFTDFAMGTKSAGQAMKAFAASFLQDVARMLAQQLALNAVTGVARGLGFSFDAAGTVGTSAPITENIGGVGFNKMPTSQTRSALVVNSVVHNSAPGTTARTEVAEGPHGAELRTFVEQVVASDLERGGPIERTISRTHGVQRRGRRG